MFYLKEEEQYAKVLNDKGAEIFFECTVRHPKTVLKSKFLTYKYHI